MLIVPLRLPPLNIGQGVPICIRHLLPVFQGVPSPRPWSIRACNFPKRRRQIENAVGFGDQVALMQSVADLAPEHPIFRLHGGRDYIAVLEPLKGGEDTLTFTELLASNPHLHCVRFYRLTCKSHGVFRYWRTGWCLAPVPDAASRHSCSAPSICCALLGALCQSSSAGGRITPTASQTPRRRGCGGTRLRTASLSVFVPQPRPLRFILEC